MSSPVDGAGLAVFRIAFGLVMAVAMARFLANGWVDLFFHQPVHHFTYHGFQWVRPLPPGWMEALVVATGVAALTLAAGWHTRVSAALFLVGFTWIELCDVSTYLNHYYLVSCLALLLVLLPSEACWSLDARRRGMQQQVRTWHYGALRLQIALVYTFAAIAKINDDWLLHGEPLYFWLARHGDLPLVGAIMDERWLAIAGSWAGFLYDLTIPWMLLLPRTRIVALGLVIVFHVATWLLFPIGMFPWIMIVASTLFLPGDWPRRLFRRVLRQVGPIAPRISTCGGEPHVSPWAPGSAGVPPAVSGRGLSSAALDVPPPARESCTPVRPVIASVGEDSHTETPRARSSIIPTLVAIHLTFQALFPLRAHCYPGDVRWHEQGFRWSWRVMAMEKTGDLRYRVLDRATGAVQVVDPHDIWSPHQVKQLETQPDLIWQGAQVIAAELGGAEGVIVHAESWASLNADAPQRLIDPAVDLTAIADGWAPRGWVLPRRQEAAAAAAR